MPEHRFKGIDQLTELAILNAMQEMDRKNRVTSTVVLEDEIDIGIFMDTLKQPLTEKDKQTLSAHIDYVKAHYSNKAILLGFHRRRGKTYWRDFSLQSDQIFEVRI